MKWQADTDVVVVGSGAAGLAAAITARVSGARVTILERSDKVGGTTAVSVGGVWVPMNHHMAELGVSDTREEALAYMHLLAGGRADAECIAAFVDAGPQAIRFLEAHTPLRLVARPMPDYYAAAEGGKPGGRTLEPELYSTKALGSWEKRLRLSPVMLFPFTVQELTATYKAWGKPQNLPVDLLTQRMDQGLVSMGHALVAPLLKACLDRDVRIVLETRALELVRADGRICGVRAEQDGKEFAIRAEGGVVLAAGGFEWNETFKVRYLAGPVSHQQTPPYCEGDALTMAMEVGADLANMTEAWWYPAGAIPGEEYEGRPLYRPVRAERTCPHSIIVNRFGQRFVNESCPNNEVARAFHHVYPYVRYRNIPAWAIFDRQFRETYNVLTVMPGDPDPEWLHRAPTLAELAAQAGIDAGALQATVRRWNGMVREGRDLDFGRGDNPCDHLYGDRAAANPVLGTVEQPPFYALPVHPGAVGTRGGPRTDPCGRVLNVRGQVIPGLYAAGNSAASVTGSGMPSGGGTLGPALVWGYLCGLDAARRVRGA